MSAARTRRGDVAGRTRMKLAVTGFVSEQAGSVASANALLLRQLLKQGHTIDFHSKATFVDPRPAVGEHAGFRFFDVPNAGPDRFRRRVETIPALGFAAAQFDVWTYNRSLVQSIAGRHAEHRYQACLWLGDFARGRVEGMANVSFLQGPPGTDARSILDRAKEIRQLAGLPISLRWELLARLRLSYFGLPPFAHTDRWIVGSSISRNTLHRLHAIPEDRIFTLPYPIDLHLFQPGESKSAGSAGCLRVLWLGRIVPRKRLDLFLDGAALAIRDGIDVRPTIVGRVGFVRGYEKMIAAFPFRDRLEWIEAIARSEVPALLRRHDVLAQPSDEENFGSSVAEAQACGLPVIVGQANGNADYLCSRDIHLRDDRPETFAAALGEMAARKAEGGEGAVSKSRRLAERQFDLERVAGRLTEILETAAGS